MRNLEADLAAGLDDVRGEAGGLREELSAATREMRAMDAESRRLARSLGSGLSTAFDRAVFGGRGLGEVLRGLARDTVSSSLSAAVKPVSAALGSQLASAIGAVTGSVGFASGGTFSAGRVRAFAKGGVVAGPTTFPMRNGTGLMGEAGPEAIMPLTRGADGRLGVRAEAASSGPSVIVNITTPDAESFRRSRGQVSAQLARAVARGNRRL